MIHHNSITGKGEVASKHKPMEVCHSQSVAANILKENVDS